jgi:hypothetical protein
LDSKVKMASLSTIINSALQEKDAEFVFDEQGNFSILKKDGTSLVGANHTKYTPQTFIDEILAQNKILKVANPANGKTTTPGNGTTTVTAGNDKPEGNNQVAALNRRNREAFAGSGK